MKMLGGFLLVLLSLPTVSMATGTGGTMGPLICKDKAGHSVAVVFTDPATQEQILSVRTDSGARRFFPAQETFEGTIEGRNGLLKVRPVLNTTAGTLRMAGYRMNVQCGTSSHARL